MSFAPKLIRSVEKSHGKKRHSLFLSFFPLSPDFDFFDRAIVDGVELLVVAQIKHFVQTATPPPTPYHDTPTKDIENIYFAFHGNHLIRNTTNVL